MTEKQSTVFNTRREDAARGHANGSVFSFVFLMAGALLLLAIVVVVRFGASVFPVRQDSEPVKVRTFPTPRRVDFGIPRVFSAAAFKRTIVENNLFRPLGWRPPVPVEPYRLIGTILPTDASSPPRAILQTTAGNQTYIVSAGDPLDASTEVVDISGKSVVLSTEGIERTLALNTGIWLNPSFGSVVPPRSAPRRVVASPARSSPSLRRESPRVSDKLSAWETVDGEVIRIGDARLKNPAKWGLRRRFPDNKFD